VGLKKVEKSRAPSFILILCVYIYTHTYKGKEAKREKRVARISPLAAQHTERSTGDEGALFMYSDVSQIETVS
jgi:hypothetical protein